MASGEPLPVVLAVLPSQGIGGGIERYCEWLLESTEGCGARVVRVPLLESVVAPTFWRKTRFVIRLIRVVRLLRGSNPVTVVVAHPNLALVSLAVARVARLRPVAFLVIFHGEDIWGCGRITRWALRHWPVRVLTVSSFSAGALSLLAPATIVVPGLPRRWFDHLCALGGRARDGDPQELRILTVFRLDAAVSKGLPELLEALERLRDRHRCCLTVAGAGALPAALAQAVCRLSWVSVVADPTDSELAQLYADADVFVLATRTRSAPPTSGEGFGLSLVEAQLAGTPVVAPALGGSDDAFVAGVTGLKPTDESVEALTDVLERLAASPALRAQLAHNARLWSRVAFDPDRRCWEVRKTLFAFGGMVSPEDASILPLVLDTARHSTQSGRDDGGVASQTST